MNDRERIINKVRKLLDLAGDDASTEGEAENAMRFAEELMHQHNIDRAQLDESEREQLEMSRAKCITGTNNLNYWEWELCRVVCRAVGTIKSYRDHRQVQRKQSGTLFWEDGRPVDSVRGAVVFYGPAADVAVASAMFENMRLTVAAMAVARYGGVYKGLGRDYAVGFTEGLHEILDEKMSAREATTTELVLASNELIRQQAADWLRHDQGIKLQSGGSNTYSGVGVGSARLQGQSDGRRHGIKTGGAGRLGGGARKGLPSK